MLNDLDLSNIGPKGGFDRYTQYLVCRHFLNGSKYGRNIQIHL